jgi:2-keto-4-pentenoate hydratase/2-oxohepta-3-ene-1,7-dioic acid hydratase in catechol pathway
MVFRPAELVRWISRLCTLEPGDVISTGTPAGVGLASGRPLADGDVIEAEIEGIGVLRSPVRAEP